MVHPLQIKNFLLKKYMETKYNGFVIKFDEEKNEFSCDVVGEGVFTNKSLKLLKARLDKIGDEVQVQQPKQKAIKIENRWQENKIEEYEIGKFGLVPYYDTKNLYVWLTKVDGRNKYRNERRREQVSDYSFDYYKDTNENRQLAQQIVDLRQEVILLQEQNNKKIEVIMKKLKLGTIKPLIDKKDLPVWDK